MPGEGCPRRHGRGKLHRTPPFLPPGKCGSPPRGVKPVCDCRPTATSKVPGQRTRKDEPDSRLQLPWLAAIVGMGKVGGETTRPARVADSRLGGSPVRRIASIPLSSALMTSGGGGPLASGDRCSRTAGPTIGGCSSSARSTTSGRVMRWIDDKNAHWSSNGRLCPRFWPGFLTRWPQIRLRAEPPDVTYSSGMMGRQGRGHGPVRGPGRRIIPARRVPSLR